MNDRRELLEYAAKAAGYYLEWVNGVSSPLSTTNTGLMEWWDPLADDGDALRLAVHCGICITFASLSVYTVGHNDCDEMYGNDACAATRRAIVRAAAEIGKAMS